MPTPLDVVTIGEAMALFAASESGPLANVSRFVKRAAGAELNVAIGLSRLGHKVGWVSRVGNDSFGQFVLDTLSAEGIDATCVEVDPSRPTGMMLKTKSDDGSDPKTEYFRRGSAASALSVSDFVPSYFTRARHLHLTGINPALSSETRALSFHAAREMRAAGKTISFDPNLRPALWASRAEMADTLNDLASHADIVMPGLGEGAILTGKESPEDIAAFYLDRGAKLVIIKLGERGAYFQNAEDAGVVPACPVSRVVDTVGAGDGFAVGVISALLERRSVTKAIARGNWIGSLAIQVIGDSEGLPSRAKLEQHEAATQA
ncbi:sugar kinase [Paraburkholderia sabiae]|uniref:Sugar kinase n=1 Tax=Paraburkholderia sabiae TaxID=273251 RepID=A0ABU9QIC9_9BURK|nr:sugar kinase [Paraburkholderia sabiae]WJZ77421.1 sugar kinase [Paraburkholderia sabiae]CAD6557756.1 2-dehydro-3-deoxygluconokinase [Paraburkholderia sabiae]